jgi:acyl-CoA thioester hydrolase
LPTVHEKHIPVRWRDCDALGHVNNAVYLTYLEELVTEWLDDKLGEDWVTVRVELDFRCEVRLGEREVVARCRVERLGSSSVSARAEVVRADGEVAVEAVYVVVAWDPSARRSRPLTDAERVSFGAP